MIGLFIDVERNVLIPRRRDFCINLDCLENALVTD